MPTPTTQTLLSDAATCLRHGRAATQPGPRAWLRASALLQRRALEHLLDTLWQQRHPGMEQTSRRAQLRVLPEILHTPEHLAPAIRSAWGQLSALCHSGPSVGAFEPDRLDEVLAVLREWTEHGVWK